MCDKNRSDYYIKKIHSSYYESNWPVLPPLLKNNRLPQSWEVVERRGRKRKLIGPQLPEVVEVVERRGRKRKLIGPREGWYLLTKSKEPYFDFTKTLEKFDVAINVIIALFKKRLTMQKIEILMLILKEFYNILQKKKEKKKGQIVKAIMFIILIGNSIKNRIKLQKKEEDEKNDIIKAIHRELNYLSDFKKIKEVKYSVKFSKRYLRNKLKKLLLHKRALVEYFQRFFVLSTFVYLHVVAVELENCTLGNMLLKMLNMNSYIYFFFNFYNEYIVINEFYEELVISRGIDDKLINYYNLLIISAHKTFESYNFFELNKYINDLKKASRLRKKWVDVYPPDMEFCEFDIYTNKPSIYNFCFYEFCCKNIYLRNFGFDFFSYANNEEEASYIIPYSNFFVKYRYAYGLIFFSHLKRVEFVFYNGYIRTHNFFSYKWERLYLRRLFLKQEFFYDLNVGVNTMYDIYHTRTYYEVRRNLDLYNLNRRTMNNLIPLKVDINIYNFVNRYFYTSLLKKLHRKHFIKDKMLCEDSHGFFDVKKSKNSIVRNFHFLDVMRYRWVEYEFYKTNRFQVMDQEVILSDSNNIRRQYDIWAIPHLGYSKNQLYVKYNLLYNFKLNQGLLSKIIYEYTNHYYFYKDFLVYKKDIIDNNLYRWSSLYYKLCFFSVIFMERDLYLLLEDLHPGNFNPELTRVFPEKVCESLEIVFRNLEEDTDFNNIIIYFFIVWSYDKIKNGYINNNFMDVFSSKDYYLWKHTMILYTKYYTSNQSDNVGSIIFNNSVDIIRYNRYKLTSLSWYMICKLGKMSQNNTKIVHTFINYCKDLILQYLCEHSELDIFLFFLMYECRNKYMSMETEEWYIRKNRWACLHNLTVRQDSSIEYCRFINNSVSMEPYKKWIKYGSIKLLDREKIYA